MKTTGYDCIVIPGAEKQADGAAVAATKQCGRSKGLVTADDGANATVCSEFIFLFYFSRLTSNSYEVYKLKIDLECFHTTFWNLGKSTPFNLQFLSDGFEIDTEAKKPGVGVRLKYIMDNTNCWLLSAQNTCYVGML